MMILSAPPNLNLPSDGKSHVNPVLAAIARPLDRAVTSLLFRKEITGLENIPDSGPQVICPTHQHMCDAIVMYSLHDRDLRYMAAEEQFDGIKGKLMSNLGAFPVNRDKPSLTSIKHSKELLEEGKGLVVFGEGKIYGDGEVHPLKPGIGWIATRGGAESIIPIAMHYQQATPGKAGIWEKITGLLATSAIIAGGIAGSLGGPLVRTMVTGLMGAIAGAYITGKAAHDKALKGDDKEFAPLIQGVKWGAAGVLLGGILGAVSARFMPAAMPYAGVTASVIAGFAAYREAKALEQRDIIKIDIGKPVAVEPYIQKYGKKEAGEHLLSDVQIALSQSKKKLIEKVE